MVEWGLVIDQDGKFKILGTYVEIAIYYREGPLVAFLVQDQLSVGAYSCSWDGTGVDDKLFPIIYTRRNYTLMQTQQHPKIAEESLESIKASDKDQFFGSRD